jgi:DNA-binding transcriptional ArsR family regulator
MVTLSSRYLFLICRAFSDPIRIEILLLLRLQSLSTLQIRTALGLPVSRLERHLGHLRRTGLITYRKVGRIGIFALTGSDDPDHTKLLDCLDYCFRDVLRPKQRPRKRLAAT